MPLWNHEYTVDNNAQESMKYWQMLVNRMDDTFIRRIRLNMFMMLVHVIIGAVISSGAMCRVGDQHGITHMHLLASTIGVVMCIIWRLFGIYYREILAARASVVYELEQAMFMRAYTYETEEITRAGGLANSAIGLIEGIMPLIVMVLYLVWTVCEAYVYIR